MDEEEFITDKRNSLCNTLLHACQCHIIRFVDYYNFTKENFTFVVDALCLATKLRKDFFFNAASVTGDNFRYFFQGKFNILCTLTYT